MTPQSVQLSAALSDTVHDRPTHPLAGGSQVSEITFLGTEESGQIGAYQLVERIGSGAMGRVYRARHVLLERMVAIKMLRPELASDDAFATRFFAEARAVNLIDNPHVIDVTDFARDANGTPWFVMELLEGADLGAIMKRENLGLRRGLEIVRQLCEALTAVHAAGIVHRDVKPENTFISQVDGKDFVKLLDFGIARLPDPTNADPLTAQEGIVGTPPYMAPEQIQGGEIDHRADLYGVGGVLFELVTGRNPFERESMQGLLCDVVLAAPPVPSTLASVPERVREDLDALIGECLAKDPDKRPASAQAIAARVAELAQRLEPSAELVQIVMAESPAPRSSAPMVIEIDALSRPSRASHPRSNPWHLALAMAAGAALWLLPSALGDSAVAHVVSPAMTGAVLPASGATAIGTVQAAAAQPASAVATELPVGVATPPVRPAVAAEPSEPSTPSATDPTAMALNETPVLDVHPEVVAPDPSELAPIAEPATNGAAAIDELLRAERRARARARARAARQAVDDAVAAEHEPILQVTPGPQAPAAPLPPALPAELDRNLVLNPF